MLQLTRRDFFERSSTGLFGAAVASLLNQDSRLSAAEPVADLKPRLPHFPARAKSVIHLFMNGGPSQMDLFDPKPMLDRHHGQKYFDKIAGEVENPGSAGALFRSPYKFAQRGKCGMWVSELLPHIAQEVDSIALVRSLFTTNLTHEPAI